MRRENEILCVIAEHQHRGLRASHVLGMSGIKLRRVFGLVAGTESEHEGGLSMVSCRFSSVFGAAVILAAVTLPAAAADDIESKAQVCSACHGQNGVPVNANTPVIWGQQQNYLVKQLHDYRASDRNNPVMTPLASGIKQEDTRPMAAYFAAKTWPAPKAADPAASPPEGIAMCKACHQPNFEGGAPAPRLAGLSYDYLVAAMKNFADGQRTNNGDMPKFMKALTDSQRDAMARYLSAL
jgi:cytochrome c553